MQLHLLDATYELFRAHFGRPPHAGADGSPVGATLGVVESILSLLREDGVTHLGCAHGPRDPLLAQRSLRGLQDRRRACRPSCWPSSRWWRRRCRPWASTLWAMVEFEADDALGAAAARWAEHPDVERIVILSPDKDMAQCVREDGRVVCYDRRKRSFMDADGVREKFGVSPASIPDFLALVGDTADGYPGIPGWGAVSTADRAAPLPAPRGHPGLRVRAGTWACGVPRPWPRRSASTAPTRCSSGSWPRSCARCAAGGRFARRATLARACRGRPSRRWQGGSQPRPWSVGSIGGLTEAPLAARRDAVGRVGAAGRPVDRRGGSSSRAGRAPPTSRSERAPRA